MAVDEKKETANEAPNSGAAAKEDAPGLLGERIDALTAAVAELTRVSRDREKVIDRLHEENQRFRAGEIRQALGPVTRDLIRLYDEAAKAAESCAICDGASRTREWEGFRDSISDILYRQGVERFEAGDGMLFNAREHTGKAFLTSENESLDNTIARMVRCGFTSAAGVVRRAEVEVYRYRTADKSEAAASGGSTAASAVSVEANKSESAAASGSPTD